MERSYHPTLSPPTVSSTSEAEDAYVELSTLMPVKQAAVNPPACLIKVLLLFPIHSSSKQARHKSHLNSGQWRYDHCFGSINFIPDASSGFFFRGVVFTVIKTSNVGFAFRSEE